VGIALALKMDEVQNAKSKVQNEGNGTVNTAEAGVYQEISGIDFRLRGNDGRQRVVCCMSDGEHQE